MFSKTNQASFNGAGFNHDKTLSATSTDTAQRQRIFGSVSTSVGRPTPVPHSHETAPSPTKSPFHSKKIFGQPSAVFGDGTSATSTSSATHMAISESGDCTLERYFCHSCKWLSNDPSTGFCCDSCSSFYHRLCAGTSSCFNPILKQHNIDYFEFSICERCHSRLQDSIPAPFPITRPLHHNQSTLSTTNEHARSTPRRSSRDPEEIRRCKSPDKTAVILEYCAAENEHHWNTSSSENNLNELTQPMVESLFDIKDLVVPLALPRDHPDRSNPFRVIARYLHGHKNTDTQNCSGNEEDLSDHESDDVESECDSNIDEADEEEDIPQEEDVTDDTDNNTIDDVFKKIGWYYKLDNPSASKTAAKAEVILWHEDSLELALEDDSDDDRDLDMDDTMGDEVKEEDVTEGITTEGITTEAGTMDDLILGSSIDPRIFIVD